jgi:hypothetical protein
LTLKSTSRIVKRREIRLAKALSLVWGLDEGMIELVYTGDELIIIKAGVVIDTIPWKNYINDMPLAVEKAICLALGKQDD